MKYWLESLAENGFDVFTVVYMAVLFIIYHYLTRWKINNLEQKVLFFLSNLERKVNVTNDILWRLEQAIDEINEDLNNVK